MKPFRTSDSLSTIAGQMICWLLVVGAATGGGIVVWRLAQEEFPAAQAMTIVQRPVEEGIVIAVANLPQISDGVYVVWARTGTTMTKLFSFTMVDDTIYRDAHHRGGKVALTTALQTEEILITQEKNADVTVPSTAIVLRGPLHEGAGVLWGTTATGPVISGRVTYVAPVLR